MVATNFDLLVQSFSQYVVSPLNAFGLGGFVFDTEGETTSNLTAEITDHYLEDGSTVQDHISIRPNKVTLKGYVGEVVYRDEADGISGAIQKVTQKLTVLNSFLPTLSKAATQAKSLIDSNRAADFSLGNITLESVNKTLDYWALAKNLVGSTNSRQQQAYQYFKALHEQKIPVSLQTPFEFMTNMAVESVISVQDDTTNTMCDFTITLKKIRTTNLLTVKLDPSKNQTGLGEGKTFYSNAEIAPLEQQERAALQQQTPNTIGNVYGILPKALSGQIIDPRDLANASQFDYNAQGDDLPVAPYDKNGGL